MASADSILRAIEAIITAPGGWVIPVGLAFLMCLGWFHLLTKMYIYIRPEPSGPDRDDYADLIASYDVRHAADHEEHVRRLAAAAMPRRDR